VYNVAADL